MTKNSNDLQFRDRFHLYDFNDDEVIDPVTMTDSSEYIPTEELIKRFLTGNILPGTASLSYEVDENLSDEQAFINEAEQSAVNHEHENMGEEAIANKLKVLNNKIKADKHKPKSQKPVKEDISDQSAQPAGLSQVGAGKPVQGAPDPAQHVSGVKSGQEKE